MKKESILIIEMERRKYCAFVFYISIYVGLCVLSTLFVWEVFIKFNSKDSSFLRGMTKIKNYPTITVCFPNNKNLTYGKDFSISKYKTYDEYLNNETKHQNILVLGKNDFPEVFLTQVQSAFLGNCFQMQSTSSVIDTKFYKVITIDFVEEELNTDAIFYFTSKNNKNGVLMSYWTDGDALVIQLNKKTYMEHGIAEEYYLYQESLNVKCQNKDTSFYDCFIPHLSKTNFSKCPKKCLPFSLKSNATNDLPLCKPNSEEHKCAKSYSYKMLQTTQSEEICKRSCQINQYVGYKTFESLSETSTLAYYFLMPPEAVEQNEYLVYDIIGMISAVGGTLGLFIGFSFKGRYQL